MCVCVQHTCGVFKQTAVAYFQPPMMVLLVSEVREETFQPHESPGGEHEEVGLPPTGALLRKVPHAHSPKNEAWRKGYTPAPCFNVTTLFALKRDSFLFYLNMLGYVNTRKCDSCSSSVLRYNQLKNKT